MSPEPPPRPPASSGGFELDDAPEPAAPRAAPPPLAPVPPGGVAPRSGGEAAIGRSEGPQAPSDLTFAERHGRAVVPVAGVREPPPGWPREALGYALRDGGGRLLLAATVALFALDLLGWPAGLRFLAWALKALALLFVVRWQLDLIGMSAGGRDAPVGFVRALGPDAAGIRAFVRFLLWGAALLLPSVVVWLLGPRMLGFVASGLALQVVLAVLGLAWLALIALAAAIDEPRLERPWITVVWLARRPVHLLVGSLGWWGLACGEVALERLAGSAAALPGALAVRAATVYLLMLSARVLGVLGRRVDPERIGPT